MGVYGSRGGEGNIEVEESREETKWKKARLHKPQVGRPKSKKEDYSPAETESALGGSSSSSPLGMPSLVEATSRSRKSWSSDFAGGSHSAACDFSDAGRLRSPAVRFSTVSAVGSASMASSVVGATPMSLPSASRASASNSFKLGNSCKSLSPKRIKNSFDDLYRIGRPIT